MRFRAKFGLIGWGYVAFALLVLMFTPWHDRQRNYFNVPMLIFAAMRITSYFFVYWDVDATGLHERRFWGERKIPWQEVRRVSAWVETQPWSDTLAVHYSRPAPMSDAGSIIASPDGRRQFIAYLRRYAPSAQFDV